MEQQKDSDLKLFLDGAKANYDTIINADNALDSKVGVLMGVEIAFAIGYFEIFSGFTALNIFGLIFLVASIVLLFIANHPKKYLPFSVSLFERHDYLYKTSRDMLIQLVSDGEHAAEKNSQKLMIKALLYKIATVLLVISSLLLIINVWPTTNKAHHKHQIINPHQRPLLNNHQYRNR